MTFPGYNHSLFAFEYANIRINHESEGLIEKSVPRTRGLPSDDKR